MHKIEAKGLYSTPKTMLTINSGSNQNNYYNYSLHQIILFNQFFFDSFFKKNTFQTKAMLMIFIDSIKNLFLYSE